MLVIFYKRTVVLKKNLMWTYQLVLSTLTRGNVNALCTKYGRRVYWTHKIRMAYKRILRVKSVFTTRFCFRLMSTLKNSIFKCQLTKSINKFKKLQILQVDRHVIIVAILTTETFGVFSCFQLIFRLELFVRRVCTIRFINLLITIFKTLQRGYFTQR